MNLFYKDYSIDYEMRKSDKWFFDSDSWRTEHLEVVLSDDEFKEYFGVSYEEGLRELDSLREHEGDICDLTPEGSDALAHQDDPPPTPWVMECEDGVYKMVQKELPSEPGIRLSTSQLKYLGVEEQSAIGLSSLIGCRNNCRYCSAASWAVDKGYITSRDAWATEQVKKKQPDFDKKYSGFVNYPSGHCITMKHIDVHLDAIRRLLKAGNRLNICTKPRLAPLDEVFRITENYKEQVRYMLSITTLNESQSIFWEQNSSLPMERVMLLKALFHAGYKTSVLVEPLLGGPGDALELYNTVEPFVTDHVIFGSMNFIDKRVDMSDPDNVRAAAEINRYRSPENIEALVWLLREKPKVKFWNSIHRYL